MAREANDEVMEFAAEADAPGSLRKHAVAGVKWSAVLTIVRQVSQVVVAVILARLLTPSDYGLAMMAFVLTGFVLTLSDASLGKALVQRATIDELDRSTVFWTTFAIGVILTATGIAVSGLVADLFGEPKLQPLVAVLSIGFVLISLQMTQAALFQRQMLFRETALRLIGATVIAGIVGVAAAWLGAGAWALIAQELAFSATSTCLLWILSPWRPRFLFSWSRLRVLGGFGFRLTGARLMDNVSQNGDNLLIGRFLGSAALGVYAVAFNLVMLPLSRLVIPIAESLFPVYSRIQDDRHRMGRIWLHTTILAVSVSAPLMLGLIVVAPEFVAVVFGSQWTAAVTVIQVLAPVAILLSMSQISVTVLLALGRPRTVFWYSFAAMPLTVAAFAVGLHWGVVGVAVGYTCAAVPLAAFVLYKVIRALDLSVREIAANVLRILESAAAMVVATVAVRWYLRSQSLSPALILVIVIAVGVAVYIPACLWRVEETREEATRLRGALGRSFGRLRGLRAKRVFAD